MLKDEVRIVINNIEDELLNILTFINKLECDSNESSQKDKTSSSIALEDAASLVKDVLVGTSELIDKFSSPLTNSTESKLSNDSPSLQNYYYVQYVCCIASFLIKIIETNLFNFSERLNKLASPRENDLKFQQQKKSPKTDPLHSKDDYLTSEESPTSENKDKKTEIQRKNTYKSISFEPIPVRSTPENFKFDYFKPATVFEQNGKMYIYTVTQSDKSRLKSRRHTFPKDQASYGLATDSTDKEVCNSGSNVAMNHLKTFEGCKSEERTDDILFQILSALNSFIIIIQNLLDAIEEWADSKNFKRSEHKSCKNTPSRKKIIDNTLSRRCCSMTCIKCCASCKDLHKKSLSEMRKSFWCDSKHSTLNVEPFSMQVNPCGMRQKKKVETKAKCVDHRICSSHHKQSTSSNSENSLTSLSDELIEETTPRPNETRTVKDNCSDIPVIINKKRIGRDALTRRLPASTRCGANKDNKREASVKLIRHKAPNSTVPAYETLEETEDVRPRTKVTAEQTHTFAWDLKEKMHDKVGGFGLFPKKKSNSGDKKERNEISDCIYPQSIVFKVKEFSRILKENLRNHFARSSGLSEEAESHLILNIIIDCLEESSDFILNLHPHLHPHLHPKTDTTSDEDISTIKPLVIEKKDAVNAATQITDFKEGTTLKVQQRKPADGIDKRRKKKVAQACTYCSKTNLFETSDDDDLQKEKAQSKETLKGTCSTCWNAWHSGLTIHQCHNSLPPGILEIRHMDSNGRICVCFQKWDESKEFEDWRWQKNPFYDPTRIEIVVQSSAAENTVLKVLYGPEGKLVKESLAETRLKTVPPAMMPIKPIKTEQTSVKDRPKSLSGPCIEQKKKIPMTDLRKDFQKADKCRQFQTEKSTVTKLGRFFDEINNFGYAKGPPLVIKVRRKNPLHDAYDLLMAPSNIRLSYYRSLRVLFIDDLKVDQTTSSTNFTEEDQSDELFELFEHKLFSSGGMQLFEYPSEETQFLHLNPESEAHSQWFVFAGAVLALAFIHQKQINMKVAQVLYKCLLDRPLSLYDLQDIDPLFYQKLMWIKKHPIGDRKLNMTFMLREKIGEQVYENELIPGGAKISVTDENKYRYVDLAVMWKLAQRILTQLRDFRRGFVSVLEPCFLNIFSVKELQNLIRNPPGNELFRKESSSSGGRLSRRETC